MEKVTLHTCPFGFLKVGFHACWKVQRELDAAGIPYEHAKHLRDRSTIESLTSQKKLPVIEFADGTAYRAESSDMAERIKAGRLFQSQTSGP